VHFDIKTFVHFDVDIYIGQEQYSPFWSRPYFADDLCNLPMEIQSLIIKTDSKYICVLPITNKSFKTGICGSGNRKELEIYLSTLCGGIIEISGTVAVISTADDPYSAVKKAYKTAVDEGIINTPLKENKEYPNALNYLGWCSWNACYHDVNEQIICDKLEEFKAKNVPIKWIIIDDGWSQFDGFKLKSFKEDLGKFPSGLKCFIEKIKKNYNVESVGIWHAFTGYWYGFLEGSEIYNQQKDNLITTNSGWIIPGTKYDNFYDFFNRWHTYLSVKQRS